MVLPPRRRVYHNVWGLDVKANVMDVREICAEKLRAMSDRARYRDFYDMYLILRDVKPDFGEAVALLREKEIRETVRRERILENWQMTQQLKQQDVATIFMKELVDDAAILEMIRGFHFSPIG